MDILEPLGWLIILAPIPVALANGLLFALGNNLTLALSLAGIVGVHLSSRPSRRDLLAAAAVGCALRAVYSVFVGPVGHYSGAAWIGWGAFLGLGSLLTLGARALTTRGTGRKSAASDFRAASFFLDSWIIVVIALQLTPHTLPDTLDRFLYAFDKSLGFAPSFAAGRILSGRPLLRALTEMQYRTATTVAVAVVYTWQRMRPRQGSPRILSALVSMMAAGYFLYCLYPAVGPGYVFGALFPNRPPEVLGMALAPMPLPAISAARNCMPSLHMATALLIWWHSRGCQWVGRALAGLVVAATAFSTLALGEHYLVDLVVAFPFTMAIQAAWATATPLTARVRYAPLAMGTAMTFGWLVLLRYGIGWMFVSPAIPWLLVISTVAYSLVAERRLSARGHTAKEHAVVFYQWTVEFCKASTSRTREPIRSLRNSLSLREKA